MRLSALRLPSYLEAKLSFRAQRLGCDRIARTKSAASKQGGRRMSSGKKKSPGWRDEFKRRTPAQYRAMRAVVDAAAARRDCNRLGVWHACPRRRCRRAECCGGEPLECRKRSRAAIAQQRNAAPSVFDPAAERAARERAAAWV